ncbi:MAG TPA: FeoA family protein [Thiolinea sp.]|nr:FeoA family protein [Thiolinea sp.]
MNSYCTITPLSRLAETRQGHIHTVETDKATRIRLLGMGLGKGSRIQVLRNRLGDVVLGNGNNRISLGRSISDHILVQEQE